MAMQRRTLIFILCLLTLTTVAYAQSTVDQVQNYSTVAADGSCDVTMAVTLYLDSPAMGLSFPLPAGAANVTMNGANVKTVKDPSGLVLVDLSHLNGFTGQYSLSFHYTVTSVLKTVDKKLVLELPLLSGFDFPVEKLDFSVTFPSAIPGQPNFTSGYLGSSVESLLSWKTTEFTVTGTTTEPLEDRESLTLVMNVTEEMFPGKLLLPREGNPETVYMGICAALAAVYWLLMMRCVPIFRCRRNTPPEGLTAGEVGSRLSSAGVDLTMMIYSWAQMGYIQIRPDRHGRVWLEKRMDMGNERTEFEMRVFRTLFAKSTHVDGTGDFYGRLCRKAALTVSGAHEMYRRKAGNITIFRVLMCGVSLFSGICFGMNLSLNNRVQVLLAVCLSILAVITGWGIQDGMFRFHIRGKTSQYIAAVCILLWIGVAALAGQIVIGLLAVAAQMLAGMAAAYGGRRSSLGRLQASQILGLRYYLKHADQEELERLLGENPDYFFDMLPYAIALGVDGRFARQFADLEVGHCPWLTVREDPRRTPDQWAYLIRKTADRLDKRQRQMQIEEWTHIRASKPAKKAPARRNPRQRKPQPRRKPNIKR